MAARETPRDCSPADRAQPARSWSAWFSACATSAGADGFFQFRGAGLGFRVAGTSRDQIPFERRRAFLPHAVAALVQHGQIELGIVVALPGGAIEPGRGT